MNLQKLKIVKKLDIGDEFMSRLSVFFDAFLSQWRYEDYLCADGIHPNEKGYQLIFDILCREGVGVLSA